MPSTESPLTADSVLQKELRLREKEKALAAERNSLLEQQAAHQARDAALETLQLKYHLAALKLKEYVPTPCGKRDIVHANSDPCIALRHTAGPLFTLACCDCT